jgi:hypothetical protein
MGKTIRSKPLLIGENPDDILIVAHRFDLDALSCYFDFKDDVDNHANKEASSALDGILENLLSSIEYYCKGRDIDFDIHYKFRYPIIVDSVDDDYEYYLTLRLLSIDISKIFNFLVFQYSNYKGIENFLKVISNIIKNGFQLFSPIPPEEERINSIQRWLEFYQPFKDKPLPFGEKDNTINIPDDRISCNATKKEIKDYFFLLTSMNNEGSQFMSKKEISHFLRANFKGFNPKINIKKFNPNINQTNLRYFVYKFYLKYSKTVHSSDIFINLLLMNFTQFDNSEFSTIKKKFSNQPKMFPSILEHN